LGREIKKAREGKRTEVEGKGEGERKGEATGGGMKIGGKFASLALGGIDAPGRAGLRHRPTRPWPMAPRF